VLILHVVIPALFLELWTVDISYSSFFFWVIALLPVDIGEEIWNFILQITESVVLNNENYGLRREVHPNKGRK
jgi:hypothetical protein